MTGTTPKWENWKTAGELRRAAALAKELDDMVNRIFVNAAPPELKRLEGTALYTIDIGEITDDAARLSDEIQAEADAEAA